MIVDVYIFYIYHVICHLLIHSFIYFFFIYYYHYLFHCGFSVSILLLSLLYCYCVLSKWMNEYLKIFQLENSSRTYHTFFKYVLLFTSLLLLSLLFQQLHMHTHMNIQCTMFVYNITGKNLKPYLWYRDNYDHDHAL